MVIRVPYFSVFPERGPVLLHTTSDSTYLTRVD
uniref:Uncharacterized protein n=1 Tax=Rhizophora mucronata TaxID=61149 RepID=A0A2P2P6X1_RHIMU